MNKLILTMLVACNVLLAPAANAVVIDFEDQSIDTIINSQYSSLGVVFSSPPGNQTPDIGDFSVHSTTGNVLQDYSRVPLNASEPFQIIADFLDPIMSVSVTAYASLGLGLTMTAYDASNVILGMVTSAMLPANYNKGVITLSGLGAISRVSWETTSPTSGSPGIDNLSFDRVPAPGAMVLLLAGLAGFGLAHRRKQV